MKFTSITVTAAASLLVACASTPSAPAGMKLGQFVPLTCEGNKTFQARASDDGNSIRIRYEGAYELDNKGNGVYEGDGYRLVTDGPGAVELFHNGKSALKSCKTA